MNVSGVPGFGVLGLQDDGKPLSSASPPASSGAAAVQNPYQQTFDQIKTWSASYLLQSLEYGAPPIPQYTAGQSANSFAQLTNMLAAIQPGIASGLYGGGTGGSIDTIA